MLFSFKNKNVAAVLTFLSSGSDVPFKASRSASSYNIITPYKLKFEDHRSVVRVMTGVAVSMLDDSYCGLIVVDRQLCMDMGVVCPCGVILLEPNFTGEIVIPLMCLDLRNRGMPVVVEAGTVIAKVLFVNCANVHWLVHD